MTNTWTKAVIIRVWNQINDNQCQRKITITTLLIIKFMIGIIVLIVRIASNMQNIYQKMS